MESSGETGSPALGVLPDISVSFAISLMLVRARNVTGYPRIGIADGEVD